MFKKNTRHEQSALINAASELPEKQHNRLENFLAGGFYKRILEPDSGTISTSVLGNGLPN